jgi:hypothetical protein
MKLTRSLLALAINFSLVFPAIFIVQTQTVLGQNTNALQRGYRTGYSDGYMAGYRDTIDSLDKSITRHGEYDAADRAYNKDYGSLEDYRDGYRQGFEKGYDVGFEKKAFESTVPAGLARRGLNVGPPPPMVQSEPVKTQQATNDADTTSQPVSSETATNVDVQKELPANVIQKVSYSGDGIAIPRDTEIMLELQNDITYPDDTRGRALHGQGRFAIRAWTVRSSRAMSRRSSRQDASSAAPSFSFRLTGSSLAAIAGATSADCWSK